MGFVQPETLFNLYKRGRKEKLNLPFYGYLYFIRSLLVLFNSYDLDYSILLVGWYNLKYVKITFNRY